MPRLTIRRENARSEHGFTGTPTLAQALSDAGFPSATPCGGRGVCGKCAVLSLLGAVSEPSPAETRHGARLMCQARLLGDCEVTLPAARAWTDIQSAEDTAVLVAPMPGRYGAAVDLGTTTVVARVYDLQTGLALGERALVNPQTAVAADVMGRISAALGGGLARLTAMAREAVAAAVAGACADAGVPGVDAMTVAGNTTMLYLLTGRRPDALARAVSGGRAVWRRRSPAAWGGQAVPAALRGRVFGGGPDVRGAVDGPLRQPGNRAAHGHRHQWGADAVASGYALGGVHGGGPGL
ncbi:MAG: 2Fe-2S iron-sulfur cluster binding domain-containing protein [Clostridiales bacterium]|nr:2Fe-2S iron-sulfur cluster binding domain-containing protein [Clostridiales bacterium]